MDRSNSRIEACLACVVACEKCIASCIIEDHKECIALCRDCADICMLYVRLASRNSVYANKLRALYEKVCLACAEECEKHKADWSSCDECASVCRKCAEIDAMTPGEAI